MVVVSNIETVGILLDCSAISYMFTDWAQFISYEKVTNAHVTVGSNNKVPTIGIGLVSFRAKILKEYLDIYYDLDSVLSKRHTLVLSNIRELDRELHTEMSTLYTRLQWSMLLLS